MVFVEASKEHDLCLASGLWKNSKSRVQALAPGQGRMSKTIRHGGVLAPLRSSIAVVLAATFLASNPTFADGNFVKGIVIGKNDSGKGLLGVRVESETTAGGRPCLLERVRTDDTGSFRVRLDPACPSLTLRFTKGGYADATVDVNNLVGDNDVGQIELQRLGRAAIGAGPPLARGAGRSRIPIVVIVVVTGILAGLALKH